MSEDINTDNMICPVCGKLNPPEFEIDLGMDDSLLDAYCDCDGDY